MLADSSVEALGKGGAIRSEGRLNPQGHLPIRSPPAAADAGRESLAFLA